MVPGVKLFGEFSLQPGYHGHRSLGVQLYYRSTNAAVLYFDSTTVLQYRSASNIFIFDNDSEF